MFHLTYKLVTRAHASIMGHYLNLLQSKRREWEGLRHDIINISKEKLFIYGLAPLEYNKSIIS